jgi:hypothetical protein
MFGITMEGLSRPWYVGDGGFLLHHTKRLVGQRKVVGWAYRQGEQRAHGRKKIDKSIRMRHRQLDNIRLQVRRKLINDIVRFCQKNNVGTVVFYEPTDPAKKLLWLQYNGLEMDWTSLTTDLGNSLASRGIRIRFEPLQWGHLKKPKPKGDDGTEKAA